MKLQFSGHESFICKHFWLKKGYDFISQNRNFNDEDAVTNLGVGKNMVASISYWLKAFGITDYSNEITEFGHNIFNDNTGKDPYIENIGTLWLLHYNLVKTAKASIYSIFFNEFKRGKNEFTKDQLAKFTLRKIEQEGKANANTINADIAVFIRNYLAADYKLAKADIEDDFSNLLFDLELMQSYQMENAEGKNVEWYRVDNSNRLDLPADIVLYTILDNTSYSQSIPFRELLTGNNSPGVIFALNEDGLYQKIEQITLTHKNIVYTETAGVKELQIKGKMDKTQILDGYYQD
ncbi:MAG TPA: DUF4007 family protein [Ferruginibacter sp.]|nr:DUF4007 family protein [Ferruginibacter sp.]